MGEAKKRARIDFNGEDFEEEAAQVRIKIQTYFSQLIGDIQRKQAGLISELDLILSNYRQGREKINELEKMKNYHEDLCQSSSVGEIHYDLLARIEVELTELKQTTLMSVDFEWNTRLAKKAKQIGKLIQKKSIGTIDEINDTTADSDITKKVTDSSLFIFSKRLYEGLIYKTDVGPIPRDSYREEHLKSSFSDYVNWRVAIGGCYWCGKATNPNPYTYVCDKKCYQYLHEWCRRKLSEFGEYLCVYPGCDGLVVGDVKFCSQVHQNELEKNFKIAHNVSITKMPYKSPHWYKDKKLSNQKITRLFSKTDTPAVPQSSNLSAFRTLTKRSTSETLSGDIFKKSSQINFSL